MWQQIAGFSGAHPCVSRYEHSQALKAQQSITERKLQPGKCAACSLFW